MTQTRFKKIPFDLELAKKITNHEIKGQIVTRGEHEARIVCFDKKGDYPIVALIKKSCGVENTYTYNKEGMEFDNGMSLSDLFLEVPTYYKDYSNFVPCKWQPCLVRDNDKDVWEISVCAGRNSVGKATFYHCGCTYSHQHCLPLSKVTERLFGTNKSYEELMQGLDA